MSATQSGGALERLCAVQPQLVGVGTAGRMLGLPPRHLLHAGPPLADPCRPPEVLMSSAVVLCLHEGWAADEAAAEALVRSGALTWAPAQDRGVVTPLAALVSAGTPLFETADARRPAMRMYAPVSAVRGPDTRMGFRDAGIAARLTLRDAELAEDWQAVLATHGALALFPFARWGLQHGDDLHSRTAAANQSLADWLRTRATRSLTAHVEATPLFFLTLWMAACALMLRSVEGADAPTLVTRAGGNGASFGIALAGSGGRWTVVPATPPQGHPAPGVPGGTAVCGAIGDSAVIDVLGFGAQCLANAPEPWQALGAFLPADHVARTDALFRVPHPELGSQRIGLDALAVVREGTAPPVALAMLGADGRRGFAGRGIYLPPVTLYRQALEALYAA